LFTYHRWRNQYGGIKSKEAKRLKELEVEYKRLKKLLADAELDKAILKETLEGEATSWQLNRVWTPRFSRDPRGQSAAIQQRAYHYVQQLPEESID
jgi:hypothetical protein